MIAGGQNSGGLLLDTLAVQPVAAYSAARKLRAAYAGSIYRARRSSDNAELDIGFNGNLLDSAALLAHTGAGSGNLATQYDQKSGAAANITTAVAADQPVLVLTGVLTTQNGSPAARSAGGSGAGLEAADVLGGNSSELMLQVVQVPSGGSTQYQYSFAASVGAFAPFSDSTYYWDVGANTAPNRVQSGAIAVNGTTDILTFINSVSLNRQEIWRNGVLVASDATGHNIATTRFRAYFQGIDYVHEMLVFNSAAAIAQRAAITANQAAFYGVTLP